MAKLGPQRSQPKRSGGWRSSAHSASGFSLIELIFAVILLTIIVFGVVKLQTSTLALTNTQNSELQGHFLANQGAEIVKAIGYSGMCATSPCKIQKSGDIYSLVVTGGTPETIGTMPFERTIEYDATGLTSAYKVTVVVKWTDSTGEHTAEAKRIIF